MILYYPSLTRLLHGGRDPPWRNMNEYEIILEIDGTALISRISFSVDPSPDGIYVRILGLTLSGSWADEDQACAFAQELIQSAAHLLGYFQVPRTPENIGLLLKAVKNLV